MIPGELKQTLPYLQPSSFPRERHLNPRSKARMGLTLV
jgi:hypothetical protein